MGKNPPSNAGDTGSIPGQGTKIPHSTGQKSPCTTTREAPECCNKALAQPKEKKNSENIEKGQE